jgi:putative spermidine/putrescine transport system permease protein
MTTRHFLCKFYLAAIVGLIYLPVPFIVLLSFKRGANISFPIEGFTLDWWFKKPEGYEYAAYISLLYDGQLWRSLQNSLLLSTLVAMASMLLVTATAMALRRRIVGRDLIFYLFLLGFLTPGVAVGLGLTMMLNALRVVPSLLHAVFLNVIYTVPFGLILMMARFDPNLVFYEQAASTLKASTWQIFRRITLPLIIFEVISAAILGFLLSWGEVIRTLFAIRGLGTLATFISTQLGVNPLTPKWYALGTLISIISLTGLAIFAYILTKRLK